MHRYKVELQKQSLQVSTQRLGEKLEKQKHIKGTFIVVPNLEN